MHTIFEDRCVVTDREQRHNFELVASDVAAQKYTFRCSFCDFEYIVPIYSVLPQEKQLIKKMEMEVNNE